MAVGLTVAALGAALGAWVGWMGAPPLPRTVDAQALATDLISGGTATRTERVDPTFDYEDQGSPTAGALLPVLGGDDYQAGYVLVVVQTPGRGDAAIAGIRRQLEARGWRTGETPDRLGLAADNGHQYLEVYPSDNYGLPTAGSQDLARVSVVIQRNEPVRVVALSVIGWLIGLSVVAGLSTRAGLSITAGLSIRTGASIRVRTSSVIPQRQSTIAGTLGLGLLLLLPGTLVTTVHLGYILVVRPDLLPPIPLWDAYMFWGIKAISIVGLLSLIIAGLVTATGRGDRPVRP